MRVLLINSVCGIRSTGRICSETAKLLQKQGDDCLILYGRERAEDGCQNISKRIGNQFTNILHYLTQIIFDDDGVGSYFVTKKAIRMIREFQPDVIHIHNLHGHYIHYGLLMNFLIESQIPVLFSFYDCWMFTGNCTHFDYIHCDQWMSGCHNCPAQNKYPLDQYWIDRSAHNYRKKKKAMAQLKNKCISPGSYWMESLVQQSFLKESHIVTVQSGVDLERFKPTESNLRNVYGIENHKLVLCVANHWTVEKGMNYLKQLYDLLPDNYRMVVIGAIKDKTDNLLEKMIHIPQTNSIEVLAKWYTTADVYVNLTLQETLGLTNVEALACGTPVVTFNSGGCPECVDESCGIVVKRDDVKEIANAIIKLTESMNIPAEACIAKSRQFNKNQCYQKYIDLYKQLISKDEK